MIAFSLITYLRRRIIPSPPNPIRIIIELGSGTANSPYSFHYHFECEDSEKPHVAMCEDWELGTLFLKEAERLGSEETAQNVRNKFLNELCREDKDTRFFMGTKFPYNTWLVLGVFWPPKVDQQTLF